MTEKRQSRRLPSDDAMPRHDRATLHPVKDRGEWEQLIRRARLGKEHVQHLLGADVKRRPVAELTVKAVGLGLATYGDWSGCNIFPSRDRLARVLGTSERTVSAALAVLRDVGLVARVREGSNLGRQGQSDAYRLSVPEDLLEVLLMLKPSEETEDPSSPVLARIAKYASLESQDKAARNRGHLATITGQGGTEQGTTGPPTSTGPSQHHENDHGSHPVPAQLKTVREPDAEEKIRIRGVELHDYHDDGSGISCARCQLQQDHPGHRDARTA